MARNGSGTMSTINSFSANTTAESAKVNANFSDVAAEITNSLPRDGQAAMTGQLKAASGTVATPGISFGSDTNTGFYRKAADTIGVVAGGIEVAEMSSTQVAFGLPLKDANDVAIVGVPTGAMMMFGAKTAPTGWVRCNGRTIGSATSGATERANADCESLFLFLHENYANTESAVSGGRGVSAAADWAANKTIALPDWRGRAPYGLDDMGNTGAGRLADAFAGPTTNGQIGGDEEVTIAKTHLPNYVLPDTFALGSNTNVTRNFAQGSSGTPFASPASLRDYSWTVSNVSLTGSVSLDGGGTPLPIVGPGFLTTYIMKL